MAEDRGENIAKMQPMAIDQGCKQMGELNELAFDLATKATAFRSSLPVGIRKSLASLVRAMNCYYSNLIEGHDTHPIDIERAMNNDFSNDKEKRDLQQEARAHIEVQTWIDNGGLRGRSHTVDALLETHRRFCEELPDELLWVEDPETGEKHQVIPGKIRERDVIVGRHVAVSPGAVPRFLEHFEQAYGRLRRNEAIVAIAAAHHRVAWIHPFLDGNGRVVRLMSHAMLIDSLDTGGVWSVARGLARNVNDYKKLLAECDLPRRNDLDGRGNLSQEALIKFTEFFLKICFDQVDFMQELIDPKRLHIRVQRWVEEEVKLGNLSAKAANIMDTVLYRGELPRSELEAVVGTGDRQARRVAGELIKRGVLTSETSRAPLKITFPATLTSQWMPGLFPDKPGN